jgi:hypothetical protein
VSSIRFGGKARPRTPSALSLSDADREAVRAARSEAKARARASREKPLPPIPQDFAVEDSGTALGVTGIDRVTPLPRVSSLGAAARRRGAKAQPVEFTRRTSVSSSVYSKT